MFGDEEGSSVRTADQYNYEALVGGQADHDSLSFDQNVSCCELICGRPRLDEPKVNLLCCQVSKRLLKNIVMFVFVLFVYIFFLSMIMGNRGKKSS